MAPSRRHSPQNGDRDVGRLPVNAERVTARLSYALAMIDVLNKARLDILEVARFAPGPVPPEQQRQTGF